jgi:hypothetical protein
MVIDIHRLFDRIAAKPLDIFPLHAGSEEMSREPMAAAMSRKSALERPVLMQARPDTSGSHKLLHGGFT